MILADSLQVLLDVLLNIRNGEIDKVKAQVKEEKVELPVDITFKGEGKAGKQLTAIQKKANTAKAALEDLAEAIPEIDKQLRKSKVSGSLGESKKIVRDHFSTYLASTLKSLEKQLSNPNLTKEQLSGINKVIQSIRADVYRGRTIPEVAVIGKLFAEGKKETADFAKQHGVEVPKNIKSSQTSTNKAVNAVYEAIEQNAKQIAEGINITTARSDELLSATTKAAMAITEQKKKTEEWKSTFATGFAAPPPRESLPEPSKLKPKKVKERVLREDIADSSYEKLLIEESKKQNTNFSKQDYQKITYQNEHIGALVNDFNDTYDEIIEGITGDLKSLSSNERDRAENLAKSLFDDVISAPLDLSNSKLASAIQEKYNPLIDFFNIDTNTIKKIRSFGKNLTEKIVPQVLNGMGASSADAASKKVGNKIGNGLILNAQHYVLQHTLDKSKYLSASKKGGLASPSFALKASGVESPTFGGIALLFPAEAIEPALYPETKFYSDDALTPTYQNYIKDGKLTAIEAVKVLNSAPASEAIGVDQSREPDISGYLDDMSVSINESLIREINPSTAGDYVLIASKRLIAEEDLLGKNIDEYSNEADNRNTANYEAIEKKILEKSKRDKIGEAEVDEQISAAYIKSLSRSNSAEDFVENLRTSLGKSGDIIDDEIAEQARLAYNEAAKHKVPYAEVKTRRVVAMSNAGAAVIPGEAVYDEIANDLEKRGIPVTRYGSANDRFKNMQAAIDDVVKNNPALDLGRLIVESQEAIFEATERLEEPGAKETEQRANAAKASEAEAKQREEAKSIFDSFLQKAKEAEGDLADGAEKQLEAPSEKEKSHVEEIPEEPQKIKVDTEEVDSAQEAVENLHEETENLKEEIEIPVNDEEIKRALEAKKENEDIERHAIELEDEANQKLIDAQNEADRNKAKQLREEAENLEDEANKIREQIDYGAERVFDEEKGAYVDAQDYVDAHKQVKLTPEVSNPGEAAAEVGNKLKNAIEELPEQPAKIHIDAQPQLDDDTGPSNVDDAVKTNLENISQEPIKADFEIDPVVEIDDPDSLREQIEGHLQKNEGLVYDLSEFSTRMLRPRQRDTRISKLEESSKELTHILDVLNETGNKVPENYADTLTKTVKAQAKAFSNVDLSRVSAFGANLKSVIADATEDVVKLTASGFGDGLAEKFSVAQSALDNFQNKYTEVVQAMAKGDATGNHFLELEQAAKQAGISVEQFTNQYKQAIRSMQASEELTRKNQNAFESAQIEIQRMIEMRAKYERALKDPSWSSSYENILAGFRSITPTTENASEKVKELRMQLSLLKAEAAASGKVGPSITTQFTGLLSRLTSWYNATEIITFIGSKLKKLVDNVHEVDAAMTDLKKVSEESDFTYAKYETETARRSAEMSTKITDYIAGTTGWARLGYDLDDAKQLGELSTIYYNVGDGVESVDNATSSLISTMKAYKIEADGAASILDRLNYVGNNFNITSGGMGEALQRSAASLATANTDLNKSMALITAGNTIINNPEKVGNGLKTVSARIRGATSELQEAGEEVDEYVTSTSKLQGKIMSLTGVNIMKNATEFKDIYDILKEISVVYGDLADTSKAELTEVLFGKMQTNLGSAILSNFDIAKEVYDELTGGEAFNSAQKEYEKWQDSLEARQKKLSSSFERTSIALIDSDALKVGYDLLTGILNIINAIVETAGGLPSIIGLAVAALSRIKPDAGIGKVQYAPPFQNGMAA